MAIVEKRITLPLKNPTDAGVERIENAIRQAGLEPVRWAIVEMTDTNFTILVNGVEKP